MHKNLRDIVKDVLGGKAVTLKYLSQWGAGGRNEQATLNQYLELPEPATESVRCWRLLSFDTVDGNY